MAQNKISITQMNIKEGDFLNKIKTEKKYILLIILIILLMIKLYISVETAMINGDIKINNNGILIDFDEDSSILKVLSYGISDYSSAIQSENYQISIADGEECVYENACQLKVEIENYSQDDSYKFIVNDEEFVLSDKETILDYTLLEGENNFNVKLYKNDLLEKEEDLQIFYIKPYEKQFLDELTRVSISTHYRTGKYEDYDSSVQLLGNLGVNYIRTDFFWGYIYLNGEYNFSKYDEWINAMKEDAPNVKILGILNSSASIVGEDRKIDTEEELEAFVDFCSNVAKHYPEIVDYQILNEPNGVYVSDDDLVWYNRVIEEVSEALKSINPDIKITQYSLSAGTNDSSTYLSSKTFFSKSLNTSIYTLSDYISYNIYYDLVSKMQTHKEQFNDYGGFIKQEITEYGVTSINGMSEDEQSNQLIRQSVQIDSYNMELKNLYNLWNTGTDNTVKSQNYGLLHNDYTPKLSYYAMKNYYENTNGAEYIGTINLADGLEAHVYDKDGKAKIIAWSSNSDNTIQIDYTDFTATDIYGEEIENTDGTLEITTSPVYLDNISDTYFYEAISNTALEKYAEFEEKFAEEIASVEGLQEEIDSLKQYMESISDIESESESVAKDKMEEHFNLGNLILEAYKNKKLDVEYVNLSSMLDMLNDIGDSFEDLVTVTATTRNPDLEATKELIDSTEQEIEDNSDIEIVYPTKILEFSQDLYDDAEYINSLEEENDIKTGLIVSYDLHAKYLADWANTFTNIYIDEYIEDNPITVSYSETSLTNENVTVTLNISDDTTITNNEGNNTYTFEQNGTFTFEYERRGRTFSEEITVDYIDKTAPVISGVENRTTYSDSVTPQISDENLAEVQLTLNEEVVEGYKAGDKITKRGEYTLIAKDEAGNETTITFTIEYEDVELEIDSKTYQIDGQYIIQVNQNTTLTEFTEILNANVEYNAYRDEETLESEKIVATGDKLETEYGEIYYIIVRGDINKDGITNITDLIKIRRNILGLEELDEYQKMAGDLAEDDIINIKDLVNIRRIILGLET